MKMLERHAKAQVLRLLEESPAVALLGPRQVGKTTLARAIGDEIGESVYLDLESPRDQLRFSDPFEFIASHPSGLIIIDEVQRSPGLFAILRGVIDEERRQNNRSGRFLLLGSASLELLKQSAESLAGRIAYIDLTPFQIMELDYSRVNLERLWIRGGFPESYLASSDTRSFSWRESFLSTYLEREIATFGSRLPSSTLRRLWIMLAYDQGTTLNTARLATALGVSNISVARYIDMLEELFLVRRLLPWIGNSRKRLIRSPKIYIRDSGVVHALLNLPNLHAVLGHSVAGATWEGFVIENILSALPARADVGFYRTSGGAEIDLVVSLPPDEVWAVEIKRSSSTPPAKGFHLAAEDIKPTARFVVYPENEKFFLPGHVRAIGVHDFIAELKHQS